MHLHRWSQQQWGWATNKIPDIAIKTDGSNTYKFGNFSPKITMQITQLTLDLDKLLFDNHLKAANMHSTSMKLVLSNTPLIHICNMWRITIPIFDFYPWCSISTKYMPIFHDILTELLSRYLTFWPIPPLIHMQLVPMQHTHSQSKYFWQLSTFFRWVEFVNFSS